MRNSDSIGEMEWLQNVFCPQFHFLALREVNNHVQQYGFFRCQSLPFTRLATRAANTARKSILTLSSSLYTR
jgi:hypothetical protein